MSRVYRKSDCIVIGKDPTFLSRAEEVGQFVFWKAKFCPSLQEFAARVEAFGKTNVILISSLSQKRPKTFSDYLEKVRALVPKAKIILLVANDANEESIQDFRTCGVDYIVKEEEYFVTARLEFLMLLLLKGQYLSFESAELFSQSEMLFDSYHRFSGSRQMIPVIFKGSQLSEKKFKRLQGMKSLFLKSSDIEFYRQYVEKHFDISVSVGITKRAQACAFEFLFHAIELRRGAMFSKENISLSDFEERHGKCVRSLIQFVEYTTQSADPYLAISQVGNNDFISLDRSYNIAMLAVFLAKQSAVGRIEDLAGAAIFHLLTAWDMQAISVMRMSKGAASELSKEESEIYHNYPIRSSERLVQRGFKISRQSEQIINCVEERFDGHGSPRQLTHENIPIEAFILALAMEADQLFSKDVNAGVTLESCLQKVVEINQTQTGHYPPDLLSLFGKSKPLKVAA